MKAMDILRIILGWFLIIEPFLLCPSMLKLWMDFNLNSIQKITMIVGLLIHALAGMVILIL